LVVEVLLLLILVRKGQTRFLTLSHQLEAEEEAVLVVTLLPLAVHQVVRVIKGLFNLHLHQQVKATLVVVVMTQVAHQLQVVAVEVLAVLVSMVQRLAVALEVSVFLLL
jgi:hypothetical protein